MRSCFRSQLRNFVAQSAGIANDERSLPAGARRLTLSAAAMTLRFNLGVEAAKAGKAADTCPYPTGTKRKNWFRGYFSAKMDLKVPSSEKSSQRLPCSCKPR